MITNAFVEFADEVERQLSACVTHNSSAAVVKDRCRADASKAFGALRGMGVRGIDPQFSSCLG